MTPTQFEELCSTTVAYLWPSWDNNVERRLQAFAMIDGANVDADETRSAIRKWAATNDVRYPKWLAIGQLILEMRAEESDDLMVGWLRDQTPDVQDGVRLSRQHSGDTYRGCHDSQVAYEWRMAQRTSRGPHVFVPNKGDEHGSYGIYCRVRNQWQRDWAERNNVTWDRRGTHRNYCNVRRMLDEWAAEFNPTREKADYVAWVAKQGGKVAPMPEASKPVLAEARQWFDSSDARSLDVAPF